MFLKGHLHSDCDYPDGVRLEIDRAVGINSNESSENFHPSVCLTILVLYGQFELQIDVRGDKHGSCVYRV